MAVDTGSGRGTDRRPQHGRTTAVPRPYHGVGSRPKIRVPLTYQVPQPPCLVPHPGEFSRFIALGDSLSIDRYPATANVATPHTGDDAALPRGLGAAALLYRNDDQRWPEFTGRDLATHYPGIAFRNAHELDHPSAHPSDHYATDGATTVSVLAYQLSRVPESHEATLFTLSAGRDDVLRTARDKRPQSLVLLTTVLDPTDGHGWLNTDTDARRELQWLATYNDAIRSLAASAPGVLLADVHRAFHGHGLSAPPDERWVLGDRPFELTARGASEVRRVWLEALRIGG